jgi:hypothetical protein
MQHLLSTGAESALRWSPIFDLLTDGWPGILLAILHFAASLL